MGFVSLGKVAPTHRPSEARSLGLGSAMKGKRKRDDGQSEQQDQSMSLVS